jgi:hypothetical protein
VAKWVVGALCEEVLEHLAVLMAAVSSYYHPTSQGAYSDQLVQFLTQLVHFFMLRLRLERYTAFCNCVQYNTHHFAGSGSGLLSMACRSGSG